MLCSLGTGAALAQAPVPVVNVWVVRGLMHEHHVLMGMDVRLPAIPGKVVHVLVVCVVQVAVGVRQRLMRMDMGTAASWTECDAGAARLGPIQTA